MYRIIGILGLILMGAPFLLGYSADRIATGVEVFIGFLVTLSSFIEKVMRDTGRWEYKVAVLAGIATILAPFLLLFEDFSRAILLSLTIGILLVILGGIKLYSNIGMGRRQYGLSKM